MIKSHQINTPIGKKCVLMNDSFILYVTGGMIMFSTDPVQNLSMYTGAVFRYDPASE